MQYTDNIPNIRGVLEYRVFKDGKEIEHVKGDNLVVDASKTPRAHLVGGDVTNNSVSKVGFGETSTAVDPGDTGLSGSAVIKDVDAVSYPESNKVQFDFSLGGAEGNGLDIWEFGLFTTGLTLFARRVRTSALPKAADITIVGTWTLIF